MPDDFESYPTGQPPGGSWGSSTNGEATIEISTDASNSPGQSVKILHTADGGVGWLSQYHHPQYRQVTYTAWVRSNNASKATISVSAREGDTNSGPWISFGFNAGFISYYDGSWHNVTPLENNRWYQLRLEVDIPAKTYDIFVDDMGTPKVTAAAFRAPSVTSLNSVWFQVFQGTHGEDPDTGDAAWIDDVRVDGPPAAFSIPVAPWPWLILGSMALFAIGRKRLGVWQRNCDSNP